MSIFDYEISIDDLLTEEGIRKANERREEIISRLKYIRNNKSNDLMHRVLDGETTFDDERTFLYKEKEKKLPFDHEERRHDLFKTVNELLGENIEEFDYKTVFQNNRKFNLGFPIFLLNVFSTWAVGLGAASYLNNATDNLGVIIGGYFGAFLLYYVPTSFLILKKGRKYQKNLRDYQDFGYTCRTASSYIQLYRRLEKEDKLRKIL